MSAYDVDIFREVSLTPRLQPGGLIALGLKPRRGNPFIATPSLGDAKPRRGDLSKPVPSRRAERFPLAQPTARQLIIRSYARRSFRDEYLRFLKKYEVEHDERYIFKALD